MFVATKRPRGVNLGWCLLQASHECSSSEFVACFYSKLKGTDYAVVDIDAKEYDLDAFSEETDVDSCWVLGNTKGCHIWVEFEPGQKPSHKNHTKCMKMYEGDYLGEKVFERLDKEWHFDDKFTPQYMTMEMMRKTYTGSVIEKMQQEGLPKKKRKREDVDFENLDLKELAALCGMIDMKYIDERESWMSIVLALKSIDPPKAEEFARQLSAQSARYTDEGFGTL